MVLKLQFFILLFLVVAQNGSIAQSNDDCFSCHGDPDLTMERGGKEVSLHVDKSVFSSSVHGDQDCVSCHAGYDPENLPHRTEPGVVDCTQCHDVPGFSSSIHAERLGTRDEPACAACHGKHDIKPADSLDPVTTCESCHTSRDVRKYRTSKHYKLYRRSGSGPSCETCHGKAHEIKGVQAHASKEGRAFVYKTCITCHPNPRHSFHKGLDHCATSEEPSVACCTDCHGNHASTIDKRAVSLSCLSCHLDEKYFAGQPGGERMVKFVRSYAHSIHAQGKFKGKKAVTCIDCHRNHLVQDAKGVASPVAFENIPQTCGKCHPDVVVEYRASNHGRALHEGKPYAPTCTDCHGEHTIQSITNSQSPVSKLNEQKVCLKCHLNSPEVRAKVGLSTKFIDAYEHSVHAQALAKGNENSATCSDCHGAHNMRRGGDPQSQLFKRVEYKTCGKAGCHEKESNDFEHSIHGVALMSGVMEAPTCTTCHGQHQILNVKNPQSPVSTRNLARDVCSPCHASVKLDTKFGLSAENPQTYMSSYHGLALEAGSTTAANCASCHGYHKILPSSNPESSINIKNLPTTCGKCHPNATRNFASTRIHTQIKSENSGVLYWISWIYIWMIIVVIGGMLVHNLLDFIRKAQRKLRMRRLGIVHKYRPYLYVRMTRNERIQHFLMMASFFTLVFTGFGLRYPDAWWVTWIRDIGGEPAFALRSLMHRIAGVVMGTVSIYHLFYIAVTPRGRQLIKDLLPRLQDVRDIMRTFQYYVGLTSQRPKFGRFGYVEKAEYWALIWGTVVMVVTGLLLWFSTFFGSATSKLVIDIAEVVHFYEAWLATLAILVWHIYFVIFNPDVYPMNLAWIKGTLSEEEMADEHPLELERLREQGDPSIVIVADDQRLHDGAA
ncbi:MAG: cytochrome B [Chlorobi bacterium]|nr:cytochrome B [Chlorobiota bacterium]